jgi:hypothetical protein
VAIVGPERACHATDAHASSRCPASTCSRAVTSKDAGTESGALVQWFHSPLDQRPTSIAPATVDELTAVDGVTGVAVSAQSTATMVPHPTG